MTEREELLDAGQAAQYLAGKWGIPSYSTEAFKMLRHRWNIEPVILIKNASLWRKSDLDLIPKPDRTRPRGKRIKKNGGDERPAPVFDGKFSKVLLTKSLRRSLVA